MAAVRQPPLALGLGFSRDGHPHLGPGSRRQEEGVFALTLERKYYRRGNTIVKRSLRPHEFRFTHHGALHVPRLGLNSLRNEADCLRFVRRHLPDVPVPNLVCDFEDDGAYHLITEFVPGVCMNELPEEARAVVRQELDGHVARLKTLTSKFLGGPTGIIVPPRRAMRKTIRSEWIPLPIPEGPEDGDNSLISRKGTGEYVFCHNDLVQSNVIVDPRSLKIRAILDWECAGFYPAFFEKRFYKLAGPSSSGLEGMLQRRVVPGEEVDDDAFRLLDFLDAHSVEVCCLCVIVSVSRY